MRYCNLLGIALVAVCALGVTLSVTAFGALPTVLPETIKTWTGKNVGTITLETTSGAKWECNAASAEGTVEQPKPLGLFHIHLEKCSTTEFGIKGPCTGLADEKESILSLGSWHLVYDSLAPLGAALLLLLDTVHFTCTVAGVTALLVVPLGAMILCLVLSPTTLQATFEYHCKAVATGKPEESKYYNETGTLVSISTLLSATNEGTPEGAVAIMLGTITYTAATLLMI